MADKKNERELGKVADALRATFQDLLKTHIKDKADLESVSKALGVSESLVKKMLYQGQGGLDVWAMAFAYLYKLDQDSIQSLKNELRKNKPIAESDRIWFSIKDDQGASEQDLHYLAACALEAYKIKVDLENIPKRKRK